jgi:hypothetical protein
VFVPVVGVADAATFFFSSFFASSFLVLLFYSIIIPEFFIIFSCSCLNLAYAAVTSPTIAISFYKAVFNGPFI